MDLYNLFLRLYIKFCDNPYKRATVYKKMGVRMGKNCNIFGGVSFGSEPYLVELGDNVRITAGTQFITHDGGVYVLRILGLLPEGDIFGQIKVGSNVFIGLRSIIMPGVTIGDNVIIGAGSLVTKDIPSNSVAAGNPAKVLKTIDEYFEKNRYKADITKSMNAQEKRAYLFKKYQL